MATAQLMEEELQQSVLRSEGGAEYVDDGAIAQINVGNTGTLAGSQLLSTEDELSPADDLELDDNDLETNNDSIHSSISPGDTSIDGDADDDDEDAGVSADDVTQHNYEPQMPRLTRTNGLASGDLENTDDEEDEGVGAVKIRPKDFDGDIDDDDEEEGQEDVDSESSESRSSDGDDTDGAVTWEDAPDGEDDESDAVMPSICMFCNQDEEHDPGPEFEDCLVCSVCGKNSHQQCARDNGAFDHHGITQWICPDCATGTEVEVEGSVAGSLSEEPSPSMFPLSRRATAPKLARDLLPSHKGAARVDSHSVFDHLVLDGDPLDGSRLLRKRKTSSVEGDDAIISLRKRRKHPSDTSSPALEDESQDVLNGSKEPQRPRVLRLKVTRKSSPVVVTRKPRSLIVEFHVNPARLQQILLRRVTSSRKKGSRTLETTRDFKSGDPRNGSEVRIALTAPFITSSFSQPFYSFFDRETDETKAKPYGGILTDLEADTTKTLPISEDRRRFDEAKQKAEDEWRARLQTAQLAVEAPTKRPKKTAGPASQIERIEFGGWEIDTWYAAPYPEEYSRNRILYICEFCLKYMNSDYVAWRHKLKCPAKHPPGDEIYRHGSVSVFEVDGRKNPVYCQNLCLLAKLFLGSKTLYYDVEPFLFYVLCEFDDLGYHFVGYFSKEKRASSQNNVSCILTLPIHQRKGYGNLLIDFSYLLTRVEEKTGSPEKPLSDMGLVSYRNYWRLVICRYLLDHCVEGKSAARVLSVRQISDHTGLTPDDVISALEGLRSLVRDPRTGLYGYRVDISYCQEYVAKWEGKNYVKLNPRALTWTPYVMGRNNAANFELGPAITAIAPREDDEDLKNPQAPISAVVDKDSLSVSMLGYAPDHISRGIPDGKVIETTETGDNLIQYGDSARQQHIFETTEQQDELVSKPVQDCTAGGLLSTEDMFHSSNSKKSDYDLEEHWLDCYKGIPPSRFEVFPAPGGRRPDRPRPTIPRPAITSITSSVPRPRRSAGNARRPTGSRPKSASSRRKTGGTGRGPGRWPKGTKKSDYGNADSGPGLPPAWLKERAKVSEAGASKSEDNTEINGDNLSAMDVVRVQFKDPPSTRGVKEETKAGGLHLAFDGNHSSSMDEVVVGSGTRTCS